MSSVIGLLGATSGERTVRSTSYGAIVDVIGQGVLSRRLVDALALLSGRDDVRCTTFARLLPVIGHGLGLVSNRVRICCRCMDEKNGVAYSMLAHQLQHVVRCPLHECLLTDHCTACDRKIGMLSNPFKSRACSGCGTPYSAEKSLPAKSDQVVAWNEAQMFDLVAFATDPDQSLPGAEWASLYARGLDGLSRAKDAYTPYERNQIRCALKRIRELPRNAPSMASLLRLAAIQASSAVELIRAPVEVLSPRLLDVGAVKGVQPTFRWRKSEDWRVGKAVVEQLLRTSECTLLPAKSRLLRKIGLSQSGFWQHYPELAVRYQAERSRRRALAQRRCGGLATKIAEDLVDAIVRAGRMPEIRRDGAVIRNRAGVSKEIAERTLRRVLGCRWA